LRRECLDEIALATLARAYMKRKRFEARLLANQVGIMLFGKQKNGIPQSAKEVPLELMMAMTGVKYEN